MDFRRKILSVFVGFVAYMVASRLFLSATQEFSFDDLPDEIQAWFKRGKMVQVNGHNMFYIFQKCTNANLTDVPTFAVLHGFPSSSFEYHKVLDKLAEHGHVIVNDHLGFGFSDKPVDFTYSIGEAAENMLALWRELNIKKAHVISHDMGDTVLTEILARRHRRLLPWNFDGFFESVTFTNGGMNIALINMRISQSVLIYKPLAKALTSLVKHLGAQEFFFKKQLSSIWSPVADQVQKQKDIGDLYSLNTYTGAADIIPDTIYYLWDRYNFEFRWYAALREIDIPTRFIWGDSDDVSPISIPMVFSDIVPKFDFTLVPGAGHFWMLECPDVWVKEMLCCSEFGGGPDTKSPQIGN